MGQRIRLAVKFINPFITNPLKEFTKNRKAS